jgi:DNA-binding transcriptional MerR regulator
MGMKWFDIKNKNYARAVNAREYSIQEVSKLTGITVRSLRNYLKCYEEILTPKRGYYNSLIFSDLDVQVFVMIKTLIKDGFKQEEIIEKIKTEMPSETETENSSPAPVTETSPVPVKDVPQEKSLAQTFRDENWAPVEQIVANARAEVFETFNETFLQMEKRNRQLQSQLAALEGRLKQLEDKSTVEQLPPPAKKGIHFLVDSSKELWNSLKRFM